MRTRRADHLRARAHGVEEGGVGFDALGTTVSRCGSPSRLRRIVSVTLRPLLWRRLDRLEWRAVGGDQLVAHQQACSSAGRP